MSFCKNCKHWQCKDHPAKQWGICRSDLRYDLVGGLDDQLTNRNYGCTMHVEKEIVQELEVPKE